MATGFKSGAGGSPLNFKVVGGTTAPANPKENTVFLHTDVPIDGYTFCATEPQPVSKNSNLLLYPFSQTTSTHNGVTFTDNGDGTITANGTATGDAYFYLINNNKPMAEEGGTYTLTGCPAGGSASTYIVRVYDNLSGSYWEDTGNGRTRELSAGGALDLVCFIRVKSGATVSNLVFRPQFEKGSSATPFTKGDATGQVWISVGNSSSAAFSVTKKNPVMVYPLSAKQYVSGAWVDKEAKSYQDGAWVDWIPEGALYYKGNEMTEKTGGWNAVSGTITRKTDYFVINRNSVCSTNQKISTVGYKTITVKAKAYANQWFGFGNANNSFAVAQTELPQGSVDTVSIDLTSIQGSYYPIFACGTDSGAYIEVYEIVMSK